MRRGNVSLLGFVQPALFVGVLGFLIEGACQTLLCLGTAEADAILLGTALLVVTGLGLAELP